MKYKPKEPIRLRFKKLRNGSKSIYLDFYHEGKRHYEYLRLYIIPERTRIDKERNRTTMLQAEACKAKRIIEFQQGKYGVVQHSAFNRLSLAEYASRLADKLKGGKSKSYSYHQSLVARRIQQYNDVPIVKVDRNWLLGFIGYLKSVQRGGKPLSQTTVSLYMDKLHFILHSAVRDGIIPSNPMDALYPDERPRKDVAEICYLTMNEVQRLIDTPGNNKAVMGSFLLACFTGLRISDIRDLRWADIHEVGGKLSIDKVQVKTHKTVTVPLSGNAIRFLPCRGEAAESDLVFPKLPNLPNCNLFLKKWAKAANISKHVTFHVSRHTAATLWLTYGADLYTVSKLLGHTNISSTQIYAKVADTLKAHAVELVPPIKVAER